MCRQKEVKVTVLQLEVGVYSSTFLSTFGTTSVCATWPLRRQTYGYLPVTKLYCSVRRWLQLRSDFDSTPFDSHSTAVRRPIAVGSWLYNHRLTEAHICVNDLPRVATRESGGRGQNLRHVDLKSSALTIPSHNAA